MCVCECVSVCVCVCGSLVRRRFGWVLIPSLLFLLLTDVNQVVVDACFGVCWCVLQLRICHLLALILLPLGSIMTRLKQHDRQKQNQEFTTAQFN